MNRSRAWLARASRHPVLVGGSVVLLTGVVTLAAALVQRDAEQAASTRLQGEVADAGARIDAARENVVQLRSDLARYDALLAPGTSGPDSAARWAEAIARQLAAHDLGHVNVQVTAARPLRADRPDGLYMTTARLVFEAPHEDALLDLLDRVGGASDALVIGRNCDIIRTSATAAPAALLAECEFDRIALPGPGRTP